MDTSPRIGPQPTREDLPREPALRVLRALVRAGAATLSELTEALGGHPNTTRVQLEHLVETGFVTEETGPATGRGRPPRVYSATVAGRQVSWEDPDRDERRALLEAVAEYLGDSPDPVQASLAVGRGWGRRLSTATGVGLVDALAAQGFTPEDTPDGIALRTCPLLATALERPDVVCGIHQGLVDALSDEPLELRPFAAPGACLLRRAAVEDTTASPQ